jgi:small subunit ribosomal protein S16
MAVTIRFSLIGQTNRHFWRIVAVDSRKRRDGACLETLGTYDPVKHQAIQLHTDRIQAWIAKGAICSAAVAKIMKRAA